MWKKNEGIVPVIVKEAFKGPARSGGWFLELNKVAWGDNEPKWDLRAWSPDHDKWGKGTTMSDEEVDALIVFCQELKEVK